MNKLNMRINNHPGFLITFCGLDGCGKTTQINLLNEYLKNKNYEIIGCELTLS
jgi:thymidylate kinase